MNYNAQMLMNKSCSSEQTECKKIGWYKWLFESYDREIGRKGRNMEQHSTLSSEMGECGILEATP